MSMDFAMKRVRFGSSAWQDATIGRQGRANTFFGSAMSVTSRTSPDFQLKTAEFDMMQRDGFTLADFEKSEHGFVLCEHCAKIEKDTSVLKRHDLNTMDVQLLTPQRPLHLRQRTCALRGPVGSVLWLSLHLQDC